MTTFPHSRRLTAFYGTLQQFGLPILTVSLIFMPHPAWSAVQTPSGSVPLAPSSNAWEEFQPTAVTDGTSNTTLTPIFPEKQWWLKFNDRYLDQYISEAVKYNPNLEATVQRIAEARAQVLQNISKQLPSVTFNPGFNRIGLPNSLGLPALPNSLNIFMLAFRPSFEVDLFGRNLDRTRASRREMDAVRLDSQSALIALQGEVAAAYFNLLKSDVLVAEQRQNVDLLIRINALKRNQYQAGLTTYDEVIRTERDVALALTNLNIQRENQALFAHQLAVLAGRPPASEAHLERGQLAAIILPAQTETGFPSELLTRRPDILASERRLERAAIDVRVARKAFLPSVNLSAQIVTAGQHFKDIFDPDNLLDFESVGINQSVFQGGRLIADSRFAKARQREQMANYRQTVLNAFKEVEDQLALLKSNYENMNSNAKRLTLTGESLKITEDQERNGLIPRLNVLQAQSELIQYQQLNAQSKADVLIATVNLFKALGGGF